MQESDANNFMNAGSSRKLLENKTSVCYNIPVKTISRRQQKAHVPFLQIQIAGAGMLQERLPTRGK